MAGSKVPTDATISKEMRAFLDDTARAEARLTTYIDGLIAALPSLASQAEAEAGTDNVKYLSALRVAQEIAALSPFVRFIHVQDQQTAGTNGGSSTSGSFETRVLNTVVYNGITGATLAANAVSLPAGTYFIDATAPANEAQGHVARLFDVTNTAVILNGTSEYAAAGAGASWTQSSSRIRGRFTLAGTVSVRIEHQVASSQGNDGYGRPHGFNIEIYTDAMIWKVG